MFHPLLPQAIFDRNRKDELPGLQLEWIDGICAPLYEVTQPFGLRSSLLSISDASSQSVTAGSAFFMKSRLHPVLFKERVRQTETQVFCPGWSCSLSQMNGKSIVLPLQYRNPCVCVCMTSKPAPPSSGSRACVGGGCRPTDAGDPVCLRPDSSVVRGAAGCCEAAEARSRSRSRCFLLTSTDKEIY